MKGGRKRRGFGEDEDCWLGLKALLREVFAYYSPVKQIPRNGCFFLFGWRWVFFLFWGNR